MVVKSLTLKTLDRKAAKLCKLRAGGRCERCGSTQNLEWSHYVSRPHGLFLRWKTANADCLCRGCHAFLGGNPYQYDLWRFGNGKGLYADFCNQHRHKRIPTTKALWMEQENARLTEALKEFECTHG